MCSSKNIRLRVMEYAEKRMSGPLIDASTVYKSPHRSQVEDDISFCQEVLVNCWVCFQIVVGTGVLFRMYSCHDGMLFIDIVLRNIAI